MLWLMVIFSLLIVGLISLIGVITLPWSNERFRKVIPLMVSFAAGAMFGDALIHLLPEAFEELPAISVSVFSLLGIMLFFALEKFIQWRHCHMPTSENHIHPLATMNLVGDAVHNLIDGIIIGVSYLVGTPIGISTTIAVILHEIPQEIGDFGVLLHAGLDVKKALFYNFMSALVALLGGVISLIVGPLTEVYSSAVIPIAAGGFIYIAGSDLLPELSHECELRPSVSQFLVMLLGIAIMFLLLLLE